MPARLTRLTLKDQAYHALREMIISHRFTAGKWINVEKLSKELGVSRTPVWQALKDLEAEGLVNHLPNRGIRMAEMTPQMALDLYQVRERLEALAAGQAAQKADGRCLERLSACLAEQLPIVERRDLLAYSKADFEFHSIFYEASGNWLLKELLENIKYRARPLVCDISPILPELYRDHVELVEALSLFASEQAEEVMRRHNQRMHQWLQAYFKLPENNKGSLPAAQPSSGQRA